MNTPRPHSAVHVHSLRLVLREFTPADFAAVHALLSCPDVMRFSASGPFTLAQSHEWLERSLASYAEHGFGKWAVVLRATGEVIGCCGPALTVIDGPPERELGYRLRPEHWGVGLATEAAAAALGHCFKHLGFTSLLGFVEPANTASARVLTRVGMAYQRGAVWQGHAVDIYAAYPAQTPKPAPERTLRG